MISRINSGECFSAFGLRNNYWGKRIYSYYIAYGTEYEFCRFYKCGSDDFFALILCFNSTMTIWSESAPDEKIADELSDFILLNQPLEIEAPHVVASYLKIGNLYLARQRTAFRLTPHPRGRYADLSVDIKPSLDSVYDILSESFEGLNDYGLWLTDTSHRRRHRITKLFLFANCTTASIVFDDDGYAFISQIATRKSERGNGYARMLLYYIASMLEKSGKAGFLFAYPERESFYSELGFVNLGVDYLIVRKNSETSANEYEDYREY